MLAVAAREPVMPALDDLHWADAPSLRWLDFAARRIDGAPVGIVGTLRESEPGAPAELLDHLREQAGERLRLAPLSGAATAELVREHRPGASPELCTAYHEASAGNPFYLGELLRLDVADDPEAVRSAAIPGISEGLGRRIARVGPDAERLVAAMAVLGEGCALADAAELAGQDVAPAARTARELRRIEVLGGEDPVAFAHPVVRRSIYDGLSVAERADAHRAAADLLEPRAAHDAIAAHVMATPPAGSSAAARRLLAAARNARERGAHDVAISRLGRVLAEEARQPPRAEVLAELGFAQMALRRPEAALTLSRARESAEPLAAARLAPALVELLAHAGMWEEAVDVAAGARGQLDIEAPALAAELEGLRAAICGHDPAFVAIFDAELPRFEDVAAGASWGARATAALLANIAANRGEPATRVRALAEHALEGGVLLEDRGGGWAAVYAVGTFLALDDLRRARRVAADVEANGRRSGSLVATIAGVGMRGVVDMRTGDLAASEADLRLAAEVAAQSGMAMAVVTVAAMGADALAERSGLADLVAVITSLELPLRFAETNAGAMLLEARGRLALAGGEAARAARDLAASGAVYAALGFGPRVTSWRSELALALRESDRAQAAELARTALDEARAAGLPRAEGVALRALGLVTGGDQGVALLRESCDRLEGSPARLDHARALVDLGAALRRAQQRRAARDLLAGGFDLAHRCGAKRLRERAETELRVTGARPRRAERTGVEALTASELRVARLAAAGRANRDIARELFLGVKTVETHLSHAYGKLGLSGQGSRARLAEALAGDSSS